MELRDGEARKWEETWPHRAGPTETPTSAPIPDLSYNLHLLCSQKHIAHYGVILIFFSSLIPFTTVVDFGLLTQLPPNKT